MIVTFYQVCVFHWAKQWQRPWRSGCEWSLLPRVGHSAGQFTQCHCGPPRWPRQRLSGSEDPARDSPKTGNCWCWGPARSFAVRSLCYTSARPCNFLFLICLIFSWTILCSGRSFLPVTPMQVRSLFMWAIKSPSRIKETLKYILLPFPRIPWRVGALNCCLDHIHKQ